MEVNKLSFLELQNSNNGFFPNYNIPIQVIIKKNKEFTKKKYQNIYLLSANLAIQLVLIFPILITFLF